MIEIDLPFPPTVNTYWRNVVIKGSARTLLSKKGREYKQTAGKLCLPFKCSFIDGERLEVEILLNMPDRRCRDIDNYSKAVLDLLTESGVWTDDEQIDILTIRRLPVIKGGKCTVRIKEIESE